MIVCSCNVFSDAQVRAAIAGSVERPRVSRVYSSLGCAAQCGSCAHTIKNIIGEFIQHATLARFPNDFKVATSTSFEYQ